MKGRGFLDICSLVYLIMTCINALNDATTLQASLIFIITFARTITLLWDNKFIINIAYASQQHST